METPVQYSGEYCMSDVRQTLINEQLQIPGLDFFGHYQIKNAETPLVTHYHKDLFEVTYIVRGLFTFSTEHQVYKLSGGDVFITKPNEIHGTDLMPLSTGEFYWFLLDCTKTDGVLFLDRSATQNLLDNLYNIPSHIVKTDTSEMKSLLKKAFNLALNQGNPYTETAYLTLFLQLLLEYSTKTNLRLSPDIGKAVNYILDHICEVPSLEMLASLCGLSASQFKHKFKAQVGTSPRDFINLQKIEYAKSLLLENKNVTEIAMELGFNTSSYFSTVFKRYTSYTPLEYRKRNGQLHDAREELGSLRRKHFG